MSKTSSGRFWEKTAKAFLAQKGYKILEQNYRTNFGEVDLIATEEDCLVFIEVKARSSRTYGTAEEAVSERKLKTIARVGEYYRLSHPNLPVLERIDVVAIDFGSEDKVERLELIRNAGF